MAEAVDVVAVVAEAVVVEGAVMRQGEKEQEVAKIRATFNASNATNMDIMPTDVQKRRRKKMLIMFVQKRRSSHKRSCLRCLKVLFQAARGRVFICMRGR